MTATLPVSRTLTPHSNRSPHPMQQNGEIARRFPIRVVACAATACVAGAVVWANALPVPGFAGMSSSSGMFHEFREDAFGWPMPCMGRTTLTTSYAFQPQRPPNVSICRFVLPYGLLTNIVSVLPIIAATYFVTLRAQRRPFQIGLRALFAFTFVLAVYTAMYVNRNAIEAARPVFWSSFIVRLPDDVRFDMYFSGLTPNYPLSRLLTIGNHDSLASIIGGGRFQLPLHVRLPLLFGLGCTLYLAGTAIVFLTGKVFCLRAATRSQHSTNTGGHAKW